jgi:hypothetical protein
MASKFLQPEFIAALFQKRCELRVGAKSSDSNSLYGALHFYRSWSRERASLEETLKGTQGELRERLEKIIQNNDTRYQECEKLLNIETFQMYRTLDLAVYRRLGKVFVRYAQQEKSSYKRLNWPECFCAVTLQSLIKGKVPTKKEVREAAFREMAIRLLTVGAGEPAISTKIEAFRRHGPQQPNRIFCDLHLGGLPAAPTRPRRAKLTR